MPLLNGDSDEVMDDNISELVNAGHPEHQAVAIAYKVRSKVSAKLKRPTLHPSHPFNNAKAPDNRRAAPSFKPANVIKPFVAKTNPSMDFRGEKNGIKV